MYTLTTSPAAKTSDATPAIAASVREYFGLDPVSFSLAYVDTKIGTGELAQPHKWYSVIYTGYLQDGTVFDSSAKHPEMGSFVLQQGTHKVIPGWDTGFYGMHVGGKRRLFIPHQLAYGPRGSGAAIPPNADLVFDIELVSQSDTDPTPPKTPPAPPAAAAPKPPTPATPLTPAAAPLTTAAPPPAGQPASAPAPPAPAPAATAPKPQ
jgi:peptidylprolyl isomerase